jgi:hypothetical protein
MLMSCLQWRTLASDTESSPARVVTVTFQVIPFNVGAHPGQSGQFVILRFEEPVGADVAYESMAGDLFLETPADVTRYTTIETWRAFTHSLKNK